MTNSIKTTDDEPNAANHTVYKLLDVPVTWTKFDPSEMRWGFVDGQVYDFKKGEWLPPPPDGFAYDLGEEKLVPLSEIPDPDKDPGVDEP